MSFAAWYDGHIDDVTRACQQIIHAMLNETTLQATTVASYWAVGLKSFLPFCQMWSSLLGHPLTLVDINCDLIDSYVAALRNTAYKPSALRKRYSSTKTVLERMAANGWIRREGLFPDNPFPGARRAEKGATPLSDAERRRLTQCLKEDLVEIQKREGALNADDLVVCMLAISLRSGLNPTSLIELSTDCIRAHPLKTSRRLLVSVKRRGGGPQVQALRYCESVETSKTILPDVVTIIEMIIARNAHLRADARLANQLFVCESRKRGMLGEKKVISYTTIAKIIPAFVARHSLLDDSGRFLALNFMRLRKTYINRVWVLSDGDPIVTARLGNHSARISNDHYLEAPPVAEQNFRLLGQVLAADLAGEHVLSTSTAQTPVARCRHNLGLSSTQYCDDFMSCVRCKSFVITVDDLYRLYSFYWLLVRERARLGARRWSRYYAAVIRLIDRDIEPQFSPVAVQAAKERAKVNPHPFWRSREQLEAVP
ncbi:MAG: hypothetical protein KDG50_06405 [Chromatiales bacterium]|nr:hypothetical protein [Chromatiales bacterium]